MGKKKASKANGAKVPKQVAGVKVPKAVRKAGKAAMKLAERPVVSEAVAAALLAAAAALRKPPGTKKALSLAGETGDAAAAAGHKASIVGDALKAVAIDVAKRTVAAWEESGRKRDRAPGGEGGGKK